MDEPESTPRKWAGRPKMRATSWIEKLRDSTNCASTGLIWRGLNSTDPDVTPTRLRPLCEPSQISRTSSASWRVRGSWECSKPEGVALSAKLGRASCRDREKYGVLV